MTWVSGLSHIVNEPTSGKCYSSKEAAEDIVTFYMEFLKDYPEHKGRLRHGVNASSAFQEQPPPPPKKKASFFAHTRFYHCLPFWLPAHNNAALHHALRAASGRRVYIAGESKAGQYIPAWAKAMIDHNKKHAGDTDMLINLKGILMGNACTDYALQVYDAKAFIDYAKERQLLPSSFGSTSRYTADSAIRQELGFTPNFYDYRIQKLKCSGCHDYDYGTLSTWMLQESTTEALNICVDSRGDSAGLNAFGGTRGGCIGMGDFDGNGLERSQYFVEALGTALDEGIPVTFFYGKTDLACDYVGGERTAKNINWAGKSGFNAAPLKPVPLGAAPQTFMQVRESGLLRVFYVEQAGHMVPTDQPAGAFYAMDTLLFPGDQTTAGASCDCPAPPPPTPCPPSPEPEKCSTPVTTTVCPACTPAPTQAMVGTTVTACVCPDVTPKNCPESEPCTTAELPTQVTCPPSPPCTVAPTTASHACPEPTGCPTFTQQFSRMTNEAEELQSQNTMYQRVSAGLGSGIFILLLAVCVLSCKGRGAPRKYNTFQIDDNDL